MSQVAVILVVWSVVFVASMYFARALIRMMRRRSQADLLEYFREKMALHVGRDEVDPRVQIAEHHWKCDIEADRIEAAWLLLAHYVSLNPKTMRLSDEIRSYFVFPPSFPLGSSFMLADLEEMADRRKLNDNLLLTLPKCKTLEEALLLLVRKR